MCRCADVPICRCMCSIKYAHVSERQRSWLERLSAKALNCVEHAKRMFKFVTNLNISADKFTLARIKVNLIVAVTFSVFVNALF